ncbi:hypothetical protein [Microbacterium elymi]|uniref:Periplasmic binding protein domain-containing protein n=1 Tax=Microbacterium elymi TaxID=2909587 RepID=A0ABY5NHZ8_9MICO|nr:hypothetical protein [Microbacterium elymi]UUT34773.1 hypothetical protein L2X98_30435 [Microbacterium elymi]
MNTAHTTRGRLVALVGTVAIAALALAGCDSTAGGTDTTPSGAATASAPASVADQVAQLQAPLESWPTPTESVSNKDALKGKTVYFIPITLQAPQFAATLTAFTEGIKALGGRVQTCDGQGTPTAISACVSQGTQSHAAAIVAAAVAYDLAGNAFDAAQAAGIPVIIADQALSADHPNSKTLVTIDGEVGYRMDEAVAKWIVADAGSTPRRCSRTSRRTGRRPPSSSRPRRRSTTRPGRR